MKRTTHTHAIASVMTLVACSVDLTDAGDVLRLISYLPLEGFIPPETCKGCGTPEDCECKEDFAVRIARNAETSENEVVALSSAMNLANIRVMSIPPGHAIPTHGDAAVEELFTSIEKEMGL